MLPIISPEELHELLESDPNSIRLVDASYSLSPEGQPPEQAFWGGRIGNAVFFDIDEIADQKNHLPHMVPDADQFSMQVGMMGISNRHQVIVYDQTGIIMAASRAWWMFRLFGHQNVRVLNGGLPAWKAAGYPVVTGMPHRYPLEMFIAHFNHDIYANMADVAELADTKTGIIFDARPTARYLGAAAEPRPNMRSGHIPTSFSMPASAMIDPLTGKIWGGEKLRRIFSDFKLNDEGRIVVSCGSGVTACVDALALYILGFDKVAVYDGSWSEWGQIKDAPNREAGE